MKMFIAILTMILLTGTTLIPEKAESFWKKADKNIERIFKGQIIKKKSVELSEKELSDVGRLFVNNGIYELLSTNELLGYMVLTSSKGRYESFEYMVVYNPELVVKEIDILNYTSSHGGEIASKKWLAQFVGYDGKHLKYGSDIDAISGATYSAVSLVKNVEVISIFMKNRKY